MSINPIYNQSLLKGKLILKLRVSKRYSTSEWTIYKIKIMGRTAAITKSVPPGIAPNFSKDIAILLKSN